MSRELELVDVVAEADRAERPRTTEDLAAAKLLTALASRSGYVVVTGDGAEVAAALFTRIEPRLTAYRTVRVSGRALRAERVVRTLCVDAEPGVSPRAAVRTLIDQARAAEQPIVVAITDADAADASELEQLRLTLEGSPDASEIIRIALLGGPGLVAVLRRPEARAVAMRVAASVHVPSLVAKAPMAGETGRPRRLSRALGAIAAGAAVAAVVVVVTEMWPGRGSSPTERAASAPSAEPATREAQAPAEAAPPAVAEAERASDAANTTPPPEPVAAVPPPVEPIAAAAPPAPPAAQPVPAPEPDGVPAARILPPPPPLVIQVGAFVSAATADALRAELAAKYPEVFVTRSDRGAVTYHRVRIAGFTTTAQLDAAMAALRAAGYPVIRVRD